MKLCSKKRVASDIQIPLASDNNFLSASLCSLVIFIFIPKWPDTSLLANETHVFGLVVGGKMKFRALTLDFGMAFFKGRVLTYGNLVFNTSSAVDKRINTIKWISWDWEESYKSRIPLNYNTNPW